MSDSFQKDLIQESDYNKYLEQLKKYYNLKKKYNSLSETYINKIINSQVSIDNKKKMYSKFKPKCINCGNIGGTFFYEDDKILRATCGNSNNPCDLDLQIIKMKSILIHNELKETNLLLINKKKNIILTKLDFLFNYLEEEKAIELFENLKSELSIIQDKYNNLVLLYNQITSNTDNNILLNEKISEHNSLVDEYKEFIKIYKNTKDISYIKEAVNLYINKLNNLDKLLLNIKYKHNNVEIQENCKFLIQNKYNIKDLEVIKKPA